LTRIQLLDPIPISESHKHVKLMRYEQVLYIPPHLHTLLLEKKPVPIDYPNGAQPGFISSGPNAYGNYFVRYWQIDSEGRVITDLRTKANSECTPASSLFLWTSVSRGAIAQMEKYL
jgi:hypothetical protein